MNIPLTAYIRPHVHADQNVRRIFLLLLLVGSLLGAACFLPECPGFLLALVLLSVTPTLLYRADHALGPALVLLPMTVVTYLPALAMMRQELPHLWLISLYLPLVHLAAALLSSLGLFALFRFNKSKLSWAAALLFASYFTSLPLLGAYQNVSVPGLLLPGPWMTLFGPNAGLALVVLVAGGSDFSKPRHLGLFVALMACLLDGYFANCAGLTVFPRPPENLITVTAISTGSTADPFNLSSTHWDARDRSLERTVLAAQKANPAQLVVLPEVTRYAPAFENIGFTHPIRFANNTVYGAIERIALGYRNALFVGSSNQPFYQKRTLVPLAETSWILPGPVTRVADINGIRVGALICLEGMFRADVGHLARQGSQILVVPSATISYWPYHFQQRAIRLAAYSAGLPVVISNEWGGNVIQDAHRQVKALADWSTRGAITARIARGSPTLYAWWGDWPYLALLICGILSQRLKSGRPPHLSKRMPAKVAQEGSESQNAETQDQRCLHSFGI